MPARAEQGAGMFRGKPWLRFVEGEEGGQVSEGAGESGSEQSAGSEEGGKPDDDGTDWRAEARKWEKRAKDNKAAADKLKELEDANKSEADKASDKLAEYQKRTAEAEQRAVDAESEVTRYRVAAEFKLDAEHAKHLRGDEAEMRDLAALLSANSGQPRRQNNFGEDRDRTPPAPTLKNGAELFNRVKANLY